MNDQIIDQQLQRFSSAVAHASPDLLPLSVPPTARRFNRPVVAFASAFAVVMLTVGIGALVLSSIRWSSSTQESAAGAGVSDGGIEEYWEWVIADAVRLDPGSVGVTRRGPTPSFDISTLGEVQRLLSYAEEVPSERFAPFSGMNPIPPIAYIGTLEGTETQVLLYWSSEFPNGEIVLCTEDRDLSGDVREGGLVCFGEYDPASEEFSLMMDYDESGAPDSRSWVTASMLPRSTALVALRLADGRTFVQRPIGGVALIEISNVGALFGGSVEALGENGDILAQVTFGNNTRVAPSNPPPQIQAAACTPTVTTGDPLSDPDRRIEDIIEVLTGERQTGDEDPVEDTIDDPNFGGVWGDFEGGVVVAVLDCSKVDANELARIAGGADYLRLIEVPHTFKQVDAFGDALLEQLSALGVGGYVLIDSTLTGRFIEVGVLDPQQLPETFGQEIPDDMFTIVKVDELPREE